jgi:poly(3-hydroxybutyrate) depolymerase
MLYYAYEFQRQLAKPVRLWANALERFYSSPYNPLVDTWFGKSVAASAEIVARLTQNYAKPEFGLKTTQVGNETVAVNEEILLRKPFCQLLHFHRDTPQRHPKVLVVAPMSGHFATLLRGTVEALLPEHDVHITDWTDAREVPIGQGNFDLDDYVDYIVEFCRYLGPDVHIIAVCQPSVPVMGAAALMAEAKDPRQPKSITLMGGPIDTRISPTTPNDLAMRNSMMWFRQNVISTVPLNYPGALRRVYPGFLQLTSFISMNLDRHINAHMRQFEHLVKGDDDSADSHRAFYDEYLAVMDLTAEFYLQTEDNGFIRHSLPKGQMTHRGRPVDPGAIRNVSLLTVEGEHDDISGVGQTEAAHDLCTNLPADKKMHYLQPGVGHYGVFNGSRFRAEVAPRIADFILSVEAPKVAVRRPPAIKLVS